jgi:PKD repeat protein
MKKSHIVLLTTAYLWRLFFIPHPVHAQGCFDPNQNPIPCPSNRVNAGCEAAPQNGPAPLTVNFQTFPSGGNGTFSYSWAFGDPGAPASSEQNPTITYANPGIYSATVRVNSPPGSNKFATCSITIEVNAPPTPSATATATITPSVEGSAPYLCGYKPVTRTVTRSDGTTETYTENEPVWCFATFTPEPGMTSDCSAAPVAGPAPLTVKFRSSPSGGTGLYDFLWTFGEPGAPTSSEQSPSHTYTSAGTYSVMVRALSPQGQDPASPKPGTFADCRLSITVGESSASKSIFLTIGLGILFGILVFVGIFRGGFSFPKLEAGSENVPEEEVETKDPKDELK